MKKIIKLIRPHQWLKNTFVFFPMFFGGTLMCTEDIMAAVITFFAFSFTASSIYCLNDIIDVDADRKHPKKCNRPIASGAISIPTAYTLMLLLAVAGFATCLLLTINALSTMCIIVGYWLLNLLYCTKLKDYAIIDVCIIAFGFLPQRKKRLLLLFRNQYILFKKIRKMGEKDRAAVWTFSHMPQLGHILGRLLDKRAIDC